MYKAIVIDLDGTLLNDNKKVGTSDFRTLISLGKEKVIRIIATGRSLFSFNEVIPDNFPIDYLIFDAGAGILDYRTDEIIFSDSLKSGEVKQITDKLTELKVDFQIREKIPESHRFVYKRFFKYNPDFDRLINLYKNYCAELTSEYSLNDATRFIIISPDEKIVKIISGEFSQFGIIRASSPIDNKSIWMEIYPKNINKGSTLKLLSEKLNINPSETIGLGNDYNDIDFLDICKKSYVVKNSPEVLKSEYFTTVSNNKNPLTEIVNKENLL